MKRIWRTRRLGAILAATILLTSGVVHVLADAPPDFLAILETVDRRSRFENEDYSAIMTMQTEDPEDGYRVRTVQQYRRDAGALSLMVILEPETQQGQGTLRLADNMWRYDPQSREFTHTSRSESFEGSDARNSDFQAHTFSSRYEVADYSESTLGRYEVWVVDLEATAEDATFPKLRLFVDKASQLVLMVEDYALSGTLNRTRLYTGYTRVGERVIPTTMIFIDELVEGRRTQINVTDISLEPIPDYVFTKAYLERISSN